MKQRQLLTGIAIFIALYMTAALGWWTYSLLKYSVAESELQLELLENKKLLCYQKFQSENSGINPQKTTDFFSYKIKTTSFNSAKKSAEVCAKYFQLDLELEAAPIDADSMVIKVVFITPKDTIERINRRLNSKQKAWLGEGVTVGLITLIIIGLMYYYLEKIIRFNQQKTNFMMAVTHELKTPIAAAKLAIQTVIRNKNRENQDRVLEISKQSIDRLSGMMERVLLATQFENRIPVKAEKWVHLHDIVCSAIDEVQFTDGELLKNSLVESQDFSILCDEHMVKIVFINLFTNAIKYSEENSVDISVNSFIRDGVYGVTVSDQGIGIPVDERNHIFEKFYRIGDEKTRSRQGSGLGLYLVKQILQLHKASINVTANTPNGSKFNIVFNANDCRME
ncbi:MAG: HAMP domain-containing histidine kinase [Bacteroidetes bacterium]|nr:HAMP domain-containing histidine kinase [Bacteroidota bacterium]